MESKAPFNNWYVAYTMPNAEKSAHKTLEGMKVVSFLPLRNVVRSWRDRKKNISIPLFPNYIFVWASHKDRYRALDVKGIVKYISFEGKPAIVRDKEIESIKKLLNADIEVHDRAVLRPGNRVAITEGPLHGVEGTLERINGNMRLIVQIECLNRVVSVNIAQEMVSLISSLNY